MSARDELPSRVGRLTLPRRLTLVMALLVAACLGIYAPWERTISSEHQPLVVAPLGRAPLWSPPPVKGYSASLGTRLAVPRLLVEWAVIAAATGAVLLVLPRRRTAS